MRNVTFFPDVTLFPYVMAFCISCIEAVISSLCASKKPYFLASAAIIWHIGAVLYIFRAKEMKAFAVVQSGFERQFSLW